MKILCCSITEEATAGHVRQQQHQQQQQEQQQQQQQQQQQPPFYVNYTDKKLCSDGVDFSSQWSQEPEPQRERILKTLLHWGRLLIPMEPGASATMGKYIKNSAPLG